MQNKISIIVPVYNVSQYLDKCISSILSQTHESIELILINDGSTDDSGEIVAKYATKDTRIMSISQNNAGVSATRNKGIELATGDFIGFIDSDDFIEPQMYERLLDAMLLSNADMSVCDFNLIYDDHVDVKYSSTRNEIANVYPDAYGYFSKYCARPRPNNYIWTRLYKTKMIKDTGITFENFELGEDTLFNFKLLPHMQKVSFVEDSLYNYLQRPSSRQHELAKNHNVADVYANLFDSLASYYKEQNFKEFINCLPIYAFTRLRSVFFYSRLSNVPETDIIKSVVDVFGDREVGNYLTGLKS